MLSTASRLLFFEVVFQSSYCKLKSLFARFTSSPPTPGRASVPTARNTGLQKKLLRIVFTKAFHRALLELWVKRFRVGKSSALKAATKEAESELDVTSIMLAREQVTGKRING